MTEQSAPTRRRGPYAKTKAKRESIIDAALEVFAEAGYYAGSLRDIAAKADISEASIFHHFPNKASLLLAALEKNDQVAYGTIQDPRNIDFLHGVAHLTEELPKKPGHVEMYLRLAAEATAPSHPAHDYIAKRRDADRETLVEIFTRYDREGRYRSTLPYRDAATLLIAVYHGIQLQWLLNTEAVDIPALFRHQLELFVDLDRE
ncbi:TetR/AcrR family transcriptional regulator [Microbacterium sp. No. 7]|uniref:TetR/AcrR family transcriptional regulator n=1 Tax=Microbacterium sp. No. 7 TaxID=1714373 RepID=UPI000A71185F|nr:TetR/AcrR family transcriptional regulator [Microbacterium sp. No. 7]